MKKLLLISSSILALGACQSISSDSDSSSASSSETSQKNVQSAKANICHIDGKVRYDIKVKEDMGIDRQTAKSEVFALQSDVMLPIFELSETIYASYITESALVQYGQTYQSCMDTDPANNIEANYAANLQSAKTCESTAVRSQEFRSMQICLSMMSSMGM